jgi:diacylglycerol kinase (ATP)
LEGVSAGLQADARSRYDGENSGDLTAGARALAGTVRRFHPYHVALSADGESYEGDAAQVFLSNLPYFGFGFRVDPLARPSDGLLEAIVIEAASRVDVVRAMAAAYRGTHLGRRGVHVLQAHEAQLSIPVPLAGDGTPLGVQTVRVRVDPGKVRIAAAWRR